MPWPFRIRKHLPRISGRRDLNVGFPSADTAERLASLTHLADVARDRGKSAEAAEAYAAALALAPGRVDLTVQHGNMLKDSGRLLEAEVAYRAALLQLPADPDIHLQLGHALKLQGRWADALAAYNEAARLDPASPQAVAELASAGQPAGLCKVFESQLRAGGIEALIGMSHLLLTMRAQVDSMLARLPDALSSAAFPIALYSNYRDVFSIPPPPHHAEPLHISVVLLADREPAATLQTQLAAFQAQAWPHRELIAAGRDASRRSMVERSEWSGAAIRWVEAEPGQPEAETERLCALSAAGDWIVLLSPGAVLDPQALAWIATAAGLGTSPAFVWDDEEGDVRPGHVTRSNPMLRQAVDYDSLLETNLYGESLAVHCARYATFASRSPPLPLRAERSALLLDLCHGDGIGHIPFPLAWSLGPVAAPDAGAHSQAVEMHLARVGAGAFIDGKDLLPESLSVVWQADQKPMHVIIPTRDNADDVATLVASLRGLAACPEKLSISVIDNGGRDVAARHTLDHLAAAGAINLQRSDAPFNWAQLNNNAARPATSPILVFANDDMRMLTTDWDAHLRGLLQRPEIGVVGVRLIYEDQTVQHAGVLLGWKGSTIHDGLHMPVDSPGPMGRLKTTRAVSAVTGAFLAVNRSHFEAVGGFDDVALPIAYSDIDFCLKIRSHGLKVLWTPRVTLIHHESKSRGVDHADPFRQARNQAERRAFETRWASWLDSDPGVNPAWHDATLPFRLLSAPSPARIRRHVERCAAANPWLVTLQP